MKTLRKGDHIRIVSPSSSIARVGGFEANLAAKETLEKLGFRLSFSEHYEENDLLGSSSIASRVADLEAAFCDPEVDMVMTTIGGFNCNELLPYLNYDVLAQHAKPFCGYSDTTALLNAIYAKTGIYTYMGPSYTSFKMKEGQDYQSRMWLQALTQSHYQLTPSQEWSSDPWYDPTQPRHFYPTEWKVYTPGQARGTIIGGNISTFHLLTGTEFAPHPESYILFLEEAEDDTWDTILRHLTALFQHYPHPEAVVFGRFPKECQLTEEIFLYILDKYSILKEIPVLYDVDFAHTQPLFTVTIGAEARIDTDHMSIAIHE